MYLNGNEYSEEKGGKKNYSSSKKLDKKAILKLGSILSILTAITVVIAIICIFKSELSHKKTLFVIAASMAPLYIYSLVFPEHISYEDTKAKYRVKDKYFYMFGWPIMIQLISTLFLMLYLFVIAQVYKGLLTLLILMAIIFVILGAIGIYRLRNKKDKTSHRIGYLFMIGIFSASIVGTSCYTFSSVATHEPCTFVKKHMARGSKGRHYYDITVKLPDGTEYESQTGSTLYQTAEEVNLVTCHMYGPFNIEYLRVHEASN